LPTTENFYIITGIEWKNGTAVAGNVQCGVDIVDASPPSIAGVVTVAVGRQIAQSGTSSVQRNSTIQSALIPSGTRIAGWIATDSNTAAFRRLVDSSVNRYKAITFGNQPIINNNVAWTANTNHMYIKVYYKPVT